MAYVKDIMSDKVVTVSPQATIIEVAAILLENHFNGIPVVDSEQKLLGLITEFDLINKELLKQLPKLSPADIQKVVETTAADVMDRRPVTLLYGDSFEVALDVFNRHRSVNPIPVVDEYNKLVGIISRFDLVKLLRLYDHT